MNALGIFLWVGIVLAVRELWQSKKRGTAVPLIEKIYLALAFPFAIGVQLALEQVARIPDGFGIALALGGALNAWVLRRRMQRRVLGL